MVSFQNCVNWHSSRRVTAGLGCFDPEHVSLPFHPFAGKEGVSQLTDVAWEPARTVWKMKMDPTNYKGVRSFDHLGLGPDLTLVACLSTGVCQAPRWTGLDWTRGKLSCIQ